MPSSLRAELCTNRAFSEKSVVSLLLRTPLLVGLSPEAPAPAGVRPRPSPGAIAAGGGGPSAAGEKLRPDCSSMCVGGLPYCIRDAPQGAAAHAAGGCGGFTPSPVLLWHSCGELIRGWCSQHLYAPHKSKCTGLGCLQGCWASTGGLRRRRAAGQATACQGGTRRAGREGLHDAHMIKQSLLVALGPLGAAPCGCLEPQHGQV